jgi:hypothetical protein
MFFLGTGFRKFYPSNPVPFKIPKHKFHPSKFHLELDGTGKIQLSWMFHSPLMATPTKASPSMHSVFFHARKLNRISNGFLQVVQNFG